MSNKIKKNTENEFSEEQVKQAAEQTANPETIFDEALVNLASDPAALYTDEVISALKTIRSKDRLAYIRLCTKAKGHKTALEKMTAPEQEERDDNDSSRLIAIARESCTLGHDADGRGVAIINVNNINQVWYLDSIGFSDWLRSTYFNATSKGIADLAIKTAILTLTAIGNFNGKKYKLHLRCAEFENDYFIDLCNESWQVVRIGVNGWDIVNNSPVLFTRTKNMRPLPQLDCAGNIDNLWLFANVTDQQKVLILAWLIESFRPNTPFPVLELCGEQGSAKSTTQRCLRDLIDPNKVPLRGRPKTTEDIYVAANNSWMVSFENLSYLTSEQQDAFCTLSTGGGFATRQYYTNGDEFVMETKRPVMLNGINPIATQSDLIERAISIEAPNIPTDKRKDEQALQAEWQMHYPSVFVGLLNLFSASLKLLSQVKLAKKYRMADFQLLGEAVAQAQGHPPGYFTSIYGSSASEGIDRSLEVYGVSNAIQVFMADQKDGVWEGTVLALKWALEFLPGVEKSNWPKSPRGLSGQLKRLAPGLRQRGIQISHMGHGRLGSILHLSIIGTLE